MRTRTWKKRAAWCLAAVATALGVGTTAQAQQVVISQVYGAGGNTGANWNADYIVLKNRGSTAVDISTWSLQYASETGTSWSKLNFTAGTSIAADSYFLVRVSSTGANGAALTPDFSGTALSMSATAGKVALVSNQTTLAAQAGFTPYSSGIVDHVGFGVGTFTTNTTRSNWYEGAGPTPPSSGSLLTTTQAVERLNSGNLDTDNNNTDFQVITAAPKGTLMGTAPFVGTATGSCALSCGCVITTAAQCATWGGTYGGDFTTCAGVTYTNAASANTLEDISGTGTVTIGASADTTTAQVSLPWSFSYFGVRRQTMIVGTDGLVNWAPGNLVSSGTSAAFPTATTANDILGALWFDLHTRTNGRVYTQAKTSPDRFIVQWNNVSTFSSGATTPDSLTFQIILFRDTATIEYRYGTFTTTGTTPATFTGGTTGVRVGLENQGGTVGSAVAYAPNATALANTAVLFTPSAHIACVPTNPAGTGVATPSQGQVGSSTFLTVAVTAGTNPTSTSLAVTGDLSAIGGSASQAFYDDATNGDVTAGDNIFSFAATCGAVGSGAKTLPFTITDAQSRSGGGNITYTVFTPPATFTDLGTLQQFGSDLTQNLTFAAGSEIKWFKFVTPVAANPNTFLDIWTKAGASPGTITDTEIAVYDNNGAFVTTNDDGGPGAYSCLSYGRTATPPTRTRDASELALGNSGTLNAGTYWVAVGVFNTSFSTGWTVTSTGTATGGVDLRVNYGDITVTPTSPAITASGYTPAGPKGNGDTILLTATVLPGTNPPSTGIVVMGDLTAIGGSSTQLFFDDGTNGDVTIGDGIYSYQATIVGAASGNAACVISATDNQTRTGTATINVAIAQDLGTYSTATTTMLNLPLSGSGIYWVKFTVPAVTTTAGNWLDITTDAGTVPGTLTDSEIGVYTSAGNLVVSDDDDGNGNYSELSFGATTPTRTTLTGATGGNGRDTTLAAGTYYLALGVFNVTFNASNFSVTSTGTTSGDVKVRFDFAPIPTTTSPSGVGSSSPSSVNNCGTNSTTLTVVVTPGTGPDSTAHTVTADLSTIGGSPTQAFLEGPSNTFTFTQLIADTVTTGAKTLPFTVQETAPNSRSSTGNISVTITGCPPANDECAGAIAVFAGTTAFNNTAATSGTDDAPACQANTGHSVWYSYTPTCSGVVTISTCGQTTLDTVLTAYADCTNAAAGTELACSDDFCSLQSTITVTGTAGVPFILRLAGFSTASGTGTFTISEAVIAPSITAQPSGGTVCEGAAFAFSVTATGSPLNYQWRKDGVDILGATSATYNIAAATLADAGSYDCVVSNTCGSTTSSAAAFSVNASTVITANPVNAKACDGGNASFSVSAAGLNLTYQWRKDGIDIGGATAASYSITGVVAGDAGNYDCVVSGDCGSATSSAAALEVNATTAITSNPAGGSVCSGGTFMFSVSAVGKNLTYQWRKDGNDIMGATGSSYSVMGAGAGDAGSYDCFVGGDCGNATSSAAGLVVNFAPAVTSDPASSSVCAGDSASFSVSASGSPAPSYQWRFNGADIMGATGATYTIPAVNAGDAGTYDCVVTNECGSATSASATLSVNVGPSITTQPSNQSGAAGSNVSFSVVATGSGTLTYQWRKNTVNLVDGGTISGAATPTLNVGPLALGDAGSYDVVITNVCGSVTSDAATLSVTGCVADVDDGSGTGTPDGGVTIDDLLYYLYIFELGDLDSDVDDGSFTGTLDGGVTIDDLLYFLYRFELGC